MKIAGRSIGTYERPYVIAEISGNHCGSLTRAIDLIHAAKTAGADAVKTQCYEPSMMTLDIKKPDFIVQGGLWRQRTLYDLYKAAHTPLEWHKELYKVAHDAGITIFSSVFNWEGVDFLNGLGAPAYKIASFEIVDLPLIQYVSKLGKPLIISTGMASDQEIREANEASHGRAVFLHCTSDYPASPANAQLGRMRHIQYGVLDGGNSIGVSDHTADPVLVPMMATSMGAAVIEKHIKLGHGPKSEDDAFSLNPTDFQTMVKTINLAHEACQMRAIDLENPSRQMRRSLYAVDGIKKGEKFSAANIRSIRPGYGMAPKFYAGLLGRKASKDYRRGDPIRE